MESTERWLPVVGFESHYEVSNAGQVRSKDRVGQDGRKLKGRLRSPGSTAMGHRQLGLSVNGKLHYRYVHRLVLEAFVGPCPDGMECCHSNGNPADNRVENLRWDTPSANTIDAFRHGTRVPVRVKGTHCKRGHEFTGRNVLQPSGGSRRGCRACARAHYHARRYGLNAIEIQNLSDEYFTSYMAHKDMAA